MGDYGPTIYSCVECHVQTVYSHAGQYHKPKLWIIQIFVDQYFFELFPTQNRCDLVPVFPLTNQHALLELDYMPDITPTNAKEWLARLLNIKAFS
jgi:hypothetical protein